MYFAAQRENSIFVQLGGEPGVRALITRFYDIIEQDSIAKPLHLLHLQGAGVAHSRDEQFNYLCGFFGGPQYYVMKHRHARLKEIHAHVPIGAELRDLWLLCMQRAVNDCNIAPELAAVVMQHFGKAAETSRNME